MTGLGAAFSGSARPRRRSDTCSTVSTRTGPRRAHGPTPAGSPGPGRPRGSLTSITVEVRGSVESVEAIVGGIHVHATDRPRHRRHRPDRAAYRRRPCVELGGSRSGEHGVGTDKACSMPKMFGEDGLAAMARVRAAFDLDGLCNPGKVLPTPRLCGEWPASSGRSRQGGPRREGGSGGRGPLQQRTVHSRQRPRTGDVPVVRLRTGFDGVTAGRGALLRWKRASRLLAMEALFRWQGQVR
jgi:hypothetical protein